MLLDLIYLSALLRVLPVSTKHHVDYHMVMFPTKFCLLSYDPRDGSLVENVVHRQLQKGVKADPTLLANLLGATVLPIALTDRIPDRPGWKLLLSVKSVPICWVYPFKVEQEVRVERIELLTGEEFQDLTRKDEDDAKED